MHDPIFGPVVAQVALTAAVWVRMYFVRTGEMRRRGIHPQAIATSRTAAETLQLTATADNLRNLLEVPVLFFTICIVLTVTGGVTPLQVGLAWAFVAMRAVHSLIHTTYNKVMHRFAAYVISSLFVWAMWVLFAIDWFRG
jgi:hypothetical protein